MPPITFAVPQSSGRQSGQLIEAIKSAQAQGVQGIALAPASTIEGVIAWVGRGDSPRTSRRQSAKIGRVQRHPGDYCTIGQIMGLLRPETLVALDVADLDTANEVLNAALEIQSDGTSLDPSLLWVISANLTILGASTPLNGGAKRIHLTNRRELGSSIERHLADLAQLGIEGIEMPYVDWSAGLVALAHRFDVLAVARGVDHVGQFQSASQAGVDVVVGEYLPLRNL